MRGFLLPLQPASSNTLPEASPNGEVGGAWLVVLSFRFSFGYYQPTPQRAFKTDWKIFFRSSLAAARVFFSSSLNEAMNFLSLA